MEIKGTVEVKPAKNLIGSLRELKPNNEVFLIPRSQRASFETTKRRMKDKDEGEFEAKTNGNFLIITRTL